MTELARDLYLLAAVVGLALVVAHAGMPVLAQGAFAAVGGVGALLRNQIATVVGLLIVGLALEPTLFSLLPEVERFGPLFGAPTGILGINRYALLDPELAAPVSFAWASAAFASAAALLRRRDLI